MKTSIKNTNVKTVEMSFCEKATIKALNEVYSCNIPETAEIYFSVPSGGDYSVIDVNIDKYNPIRVKWEKVTWEEVTA